MRATSSVRSCLNAPLGWAIFLLLSVGAQAHAQVKVMPLGDSITVGAIPSQPPGPNGYGGYRAPLYTALLNLGLNVDFVGSLSDGPLTIDRNHEGHGGFQITQINDGVQAWLSGAQPDVILLHIGINDLLNGVTPSTASQRLATLIDRITATRPTAYLFVSSLVPTLPVNAANLPPATVAELNQLIPMIVNDRAMLGKRVIFVDIANLAGFTPSDYDPDGFHPDDSGYAKMATVWRNAITAFLDADAPPTSGVTAPFAGATVAGNVTLSANAFDDVAVTSVKFLVDNVQVTEDFTAPYQISWNSGSVANGAHSVSVVAKDTANQTSTQLVGINVSNGSGTTGLMAAYAFDAGSGPTAIDSSGRGNTATIAGPTWTPSGHSGAALDFDGVNDRVEIPPPATDLRFTTSMTLEAWINPSSLPSGWHMILARQVGTGFSDSWFLATNGSVLNFYAGALVTSSLTAGQWTHVAGVKNGATVELYVNGVLMASASNATSPLPNDANEVGIGAGDNGAAAWSEFFLGRIDDVRFYNRALAPSQVASDMVTAVGTPAGPPDVTPPLISNVVPSMVSSGSAVVTWNTNEPADTQVEYGVSGYTATSAILTSLTTSHSRTLTNLVAGTTYHFRVDSRDAAGNLAVSGDFTFTTSTGPSPTLAYGFEEGTGSTAQDSSGNGHAGTLTAGATRTIGHVGGGIMLDGASGGVNADGAGLNPGADDFTAMAWIKTSGATVQRVLSKRPLCASGSFWNLLLFPNGTAVLEVSQDVAATNYFYVQGGTPVNNGQWHHVAVVRVGAILRLYVDGALDAEAVGPGIANVSNAAAFQVGLNPCGESFSGHIDDVRLFQQALPIDGVQAFMNQSVGTPLPPPAPIALALGLEEGTGTSATDTAGNDNPGTLSGGVTWTAGKYGQGLNFDGISGQVTVANAAVLNPGTSDFTAAAWVKTPSATFEPILAKRASCGAGSFWNLHMGALHAGRVVVEVSENSASTDYFFVEGATAINDNAWHHVAVVRIGATLQLYVDGALDGTGTGPGVAAISNTGTLQIGTYPCGQFFNGQLDEIRLYQGALDATQIDAARTTPIAPAFATALAAYNFDEGAGSTATDLSGRGNTMQLAGAGWTAGHDGSALNFNGVNQRAEIPAPATDLQKSSTFTIDAWINPTTLPAGWHMIVARQLGTSSGDAYLLAHNGTTLQFFAGGLIGAPIVAGQWQHVAAVKNGSTLQLYVNGGLVASTNTATTPIAVDANEMGIGAGNNGNPLWQEFFNGKLDDLRFYDVALTPGQVQIDMATPVGGVMDTTPPVLSNIVEDPTDTSVTVTWTTDEPSTSQVFYGPTPSYGSQSALDAALVTSHSVVINGLTADSDYHYKVESKDASNNGATSTDHQFHTDVTIVPIVQVLALGFGEGAGTQTLDAAGNDNPGTLSGGVTWTPGKYGQGLSFNGVNGRVTVVNAAVLNPGPSDFTAAVWVKTATAAFQPILAKRAACTAGSFWNLHMGALHAGRVVVEVSEDSASTDYFFVEGATAINDNAWHHVAVVRVGATLQLYVDGLLDGTGTGPGVAAISNTGTLQIGTYPCGQFFNGQLDEVRLYQGALDAAQIDTARTTPIAGNGATALAAYNFDEGAGSTATDLSGRGNTMQLAGAGWTAGHAGSALNFNGVNQRAEIPAPATDLQKSSTFTIDAWINPTTLPAGWHMIVARQLGTSSGDAYLLAHNGTTLQFFAGGLIGAPIVAGQWQHVAAVKNGSTLQLYVNGALAASTNTATTPIAVDANEVGIGAGSNGNPLWDEFFNGKLDDLRFYDVALTEGQIDFDMATPVGAVVDPNPPVLSNILADPSDTSVTVTWTTDEPSTSQVFYGPTTLYGSQSPLDLTLVTSHIVVINGLTADSDYHYFVQSKDATNNLATSSDQPFHTDVTPVPITQVLALGLEEATGPVATDSAGNDNPGALSGGVTRTAGKYGQGLTFDGVSGQVTVANAAVLNPGASDFTVAVWVKTASVGFQPILAKRAACAAGSFWNLHMGALNAGRVVVEVSEDAAATDYFFVEGTTAINDNAWHHVAVVRSGVTLRLYVDGVLNATGTGPGIAAISNTGTLQIGTYPCGPFFNGQLDEVRLYQGALDAAQINSARTTPIVGGAPPLAPLAAYNFNEGTGTAVTDRTGRGNTMQLTGATWPAGHGAGSALGFDGLSQRGEIPTPATDFQQASTFTIEAWINPTTLAAGWHMIVARQLGTSVGDAYLLAHNGTTLQFFAGGLIGAPIVAGQWQHVAAVKNGSTLQLYVNGGLVASTNAATTPIAVDANEMGIGAGSNGNPLWQEFFAGRIDDLRFYNVALSSDQIQVDMATPVP